MGFARWIDKRIPRAKVALRVSAGWGLREAIDSGVGVTIIPCALGEVMPGWRRVRLVSDTAAPLWVLTHRDIRIPQDTKEFAINASRARHWDAPIKRYIDELVAGRDGPREQDFNMRWVASMVADVHRILARGGVFLYPVDARNRASGGHGLGLAICQKIVAAHRGTIEARHSPLGGVWMHMRFPKQPSDATIDTAHGDAR